MVELKTKEKSYLEKRGFYEIKVRFPDLETLDKSMIPVDNFIEDGYLYDYLNYLNYKIIENYERVKVSKYDNKIEIGVW